MTTDTMTKPRNFYWQPWRSAPTEEKNVTAIFQKLNLEDSGSDHRRVLPVLTWLQR